MTENQAQVNQNIDSKASDKELNFRALEAKYKRELEQERNARLEAERLAQEIHNSNLQRKGNNKIQSQ